MSGKKSPVILVIVALLMFAGIYFLQTWLVRNELNNVLKIKTDTIMLEFRSITNSSVTNTFTIDEASVSKLESSIENILRLENGYTREYVNQIIKNSTDVTTFWLAFLSMFMAIFGLFSIYANNNILKKTEEEYNKTVKKIEQESKTIIEKLTKKSDDAMKKIQEIEINIKESEEKAEESKKEAKAASLFIQGFNADKEKKYDDAIKYYTEGIELNPDNSYAYNNRGIVYRKLEKYDLAIADYSKAIGLNSKYGDAYYNRGCTYSKLKNYEKAIADYSKAIDLNPNHSGAYNNRGYAYYKINEYDKAMKDLDKDIELNPKYSEAYNNRGYAYYKKNEYDKAIKDLDKSIELNSNNNEAYINKGLVYYKQEEYDKAMNDFEKVPIDMIKYDEESLEAIKGMAKKGNKRAIEFCKKNNIEY